MNQLTQFSLLSLALLFCTTDTNGATVELGSRLIGGIESEEGSFPYHVQLRNSSGYFCGGALITTRHVLTSITCVDGRDATSISVITGSNQLSTGGETHSVVSVDLHEGYLAPPTTIYTFDVAILTLADDITVTSLQSPIPVSSSQPPAGSTVVSTGYGSTISGSIILAETLRYLNLVTLDTATCRSDMLTSLLTDDHLCAVPDAGTGPCTGDAGDPLAYNGELVGVYSFGRAGCASGFPEVFTRLTSALNFITSITGLEF